MAVTRSTPASRRRSPETGAVPSWDQRPGRRGARRREALLLAAAAAVVLLGMVLVDRAVSLPFADAAAGLTRGQVLDLSQVDRPEDLLPFLPPDLPPAERELTAERIRQRLAEGAVPNVGELGRLRVEAGEIGDAARFPRLAERLASSTRPSVPLLSAAELREMKPRLVVRTPGAFQRGFWLWGLLLLAGFAAVHALWRFLRFPGDELPLPLLLLLTGTGFLLMTSVRDPLRDLPLYRTFAQGVLAGCALLAAVSLADLERRLARFTFLPLGIAVGLSALLVAFGSGPGTSDARVNLLGVQPVEAIKLLVVLFLAGYLADRWEFLRELTEKSPGLAPLARRLRLPRLDYALPPLVAIGLVLFFFFLQRDLGPALVLSFLFLLLWAVARGRAGMAVAGTLLVVAAFFAGYRLGYPHTVAGRIQMWLSPWDTTFRGGDHLAQALWALASGRATGAGLGLGEPGRVPEAHTDMVLSGIGEELGFAGVAAVLALYAVLVVRGFRAALRAGRPYGFFLALGLTLLLALQVALIAGGVVGLVPLSGVASPFLSFGRSAMLANFLLVGALLAISARPGETAVSTAGGAGATRRFHPAARRVGLALALVLAAIAARAFQVQVLAADRTSTRGALALQGDGMRRFQYDPRLARLAEAIPRGAIVDRNGLPLATSDRAALAAHRELLEKLGAAVPRPADPEGRVYPFAGRTFHLLGDLSNRVNWAASNTSYVERDSRVLLQGYDDYAALVEVRQPDGSITREIELDYRELLPLLRHRHEPDHPEVKAILDRDRTLKMTVDARLQARAGDALAAVARAAGRPGAAAVVLDARTGDLLASVSWPWPAKLPVEPSEDPAKGVVDRARYGIYPPGSTFKLVTAMAALAKDPALAARTFECKPLSDGRVGNRIRGWGRPVRDDPTVTSPHGTVDLAKGIRQSCNAYFAQLGTYAVGAQQLLETARLLGITVARPNTPQALADALPQASYGQGQVVATPFQMARVAATVANGGAMPEGRWILGPTNPRTGAPIRVLPPEEARRLARSMREVVTVGTASHILGGVRPPIAGKTGTAEVQGKPSHSWFIGFAPAEGPGRRIAFAVIIEHGGYGGRLAAQAAGEIVRQAAALGLAGMPGAGQEPEQGPEAEPSARQEAP